MVYKLYGFPMSTCTRRVLITAAELGDDVEVVSVEKSEIKTPEFKKHQPFGSVPWFEDTEAGIELYESRAIGRYLAAKAGSDLAPNPKSPSYFSDLAKFETAASIEYSNFDPLASTLASEKVFKPMRGLTVDQAKCDSLKEALTGKLDGFEAILGKQKYLAGDEFTLVDIFALPYSAMLFKADAADLVTSRPNFDRWYKSVAQRPSVKKYFP